VLRVLRRIFGLKRAEITGGWRKLHNEELRNFYSSPNIIRMIKSRGMIRAGYVARIEENRNAYRVLVGKPDGERPLGRPGRMWVGSINPNNSDLNALHSDLNAQLGLSTA
jgi:hypothetical protein